MASNERKLRFGVDLTGDETFRQGLQKIETGLKNVKAAQSGLNSEYGKGDKSLGKLTQQQELLQSKLKLQKQKLEEIRKEHERVAEAEGENSDQAQELARQYEYARAACNNTERELSELTKEMQAASSKTEAFKKTLHDAGGKLEEIGGKVEKVGNTMTKVFTVAIAGAMTYCTKAFMDFENGMATVSTIADTSAKSMEQLSDEALEASNATGVAATAITEAAYSAISAGVDTADSMGYVTEASKAAKAGLSDVQTVVDGSTSIMNAWKIATSDATTVFDKMIIAQNEGKTTINEIASQIGQLTGLAPQLNISLDETLSAIAALTKNGVKTSSAINGLKNIMSGVLKPTAEAKEAAEALGLEFSAEALQAKGLTGFLADLAEKTGGSEEIMAKLFGSVEGLSSVLLLGNAAAQDYADTMDAMASSAGALDTAFEKVTSSRAEQLKKSLNQLNNEAIRLGQAVAPMVDLATGAISKLADTLNSMTPAQQQTMITIAAVLAAIGPLTSGVGKVTKTVGTLMKAFSKTNIATTGWVAAAVAGIALIVAGVVALKNHLDSLKPEARIAAAGSRIRIDTEAITAAIEKAEGLKHEMDLVLQAKIKLETDSQALQNEIITWLTDGERETKKQKEEYKAKADEVFKPVYDALQTAFDEKKAELDTALAQGIISPETYQQSIDKLTETTEAAKSALDTEKKAYVDYVIALANANRKPTDDEIAKLEELRLKVVAVGQEILESTNTALQAAQGSYNLVKSGGGTTENVAVAISYVQADRANKLATAQSLYDSAMGELQQKFAEAEQKGDNEVTAQVAIDMQAVTDDFEQQKTDIETQYTDMMSQIADGIAEKYPEAAAQIKAIAENQKLYEELLAAMSELPEAETEEAAAALQEEIKRIYEKATGEKAWGDNFVLMGTVAADDLKKSIAEAVEKAADDGSFNDIFTDLSAAIDMGALNGLDFSSVGTTLSSMLTTLDLTDDGKTIGQQLITGEKTGIVEGQDDLNSAIRQSCTDANNALKEAQGIHSPSTVWGKFGTETIAGYTGAIKRGKSAVISAVNVISSALYAAGANTINSMINGANSRRAALISTYSSIAGAAISAAKRKLQIASPSKPFLAFGENTGDALITGINRKVEKVKAAMNRMVNPSDVTGRQPEARQSETGALAAVGGGGGNTIIVNYSGSVTGRDSRKLAQQLGKYTRNQNTSKGK